MATILAQLFAREENKKICAVSLDPNGCQIFLLKDDKTPVFPNIDVMVSIKTLPSKEDLKNSGYDHVVIDVQPGMSQSGLKKIANVSNCVVIPVLIQRDAITQARKTFDVITSEANKQDLKITVQFVVLLEDRLTSLMKQLLEQAKEELGQPYQCLPMSRKIWGNFSRHNAFDKGIASGEVLIWSEFAQELISC